VPIRNLGGGKKLGKGGQRSKDDLIIGVGGGLTVGEEGGTGK